ncbi:monooxygenase 2 isoform X2 [Arachis hypogaea]|uniref:monooxygenase 2 isoform X2 n=1 Tax=Arachis hypogaea TaxID=3818 RepID=UPI003B21A4E4
MAMASATSSLTILRSPSAFVSTLSHATKMLMRSGSFQPSNRGNGEVRKEEVVIVGGGIAGLATAVSLDRLGVKSTVLEQAESFRSGGTSLTLSKNGWSVLDAIGVANRLRSQFSQIEGSEDGKQLRSFNLLEEDPSQELRGVERRILLETLAAELPKGAIQFSSKLARIEPTSEGDILLELADGSKLHATTVIGCDGIGSPIAKWMGFHEPKYVGYCAIRGLATYSDGQPYEPRVNYFYGRGVRAAYVPVSPTKVYWFVCFNSPSPGPSTTDSSVLKKQAKELVRNWPSELLDIVDSTPDDTIIRNPLADRWLWPTISPPASTGRIVLVGDAWHPMTPNLGQGACCALEDAVVLAKKLAGAINSKDQYSVEEAFRSYGSERWRRVFPLTVRAHLVGSILQWENPLVCSIRNKIIIPKLASLKPMLEHTNFTCESLQEEKQ